MLSLKHVLLLFTLNVYSHCTYGDRIYFSINGTEGEKTDVQDNSECTINGTQAGNCQLIRNCPAAVEGLHVGTRPETCGFNENEVMVCCVPTNETLRLSERMCKQYEQLCESGWYVAEEPLIVVGGGTVSDPREFPHMAAIGYGIPPEIKWNCGASLISDRYVLSAAHCTHPGGRLGSARWVRLGDLNVKLNDDDARPEDFEIVQHVNHPDYKPPVIYNDIALYKLDRPVRFNEYIRPICLHASYQTPSGKGTATGWGRLGYIHPVSDILMKVKLTFISSSNCSTLRETNQFQLPSGIDNKTMVCAGEKEGVKDTCQGDSSGPLSIDGDKCIPTQVGITSAGPLCGLPNSPGIYTRIAHFVPWIESIVWRSD